MIVENRLNIYNMYLTKTALNQRIQKWHNMGEKLV